MPFWVYILKCSDGSYYTGHTDDLQHRVEMHHAGVLAGYTHDRRPVELAFSQQCQTREEASAAEVQIKRLEPQEERSAVSWRLDAINKLGRGKHRHER